MVKCVHYPACELEKVTEAERNAAVLAMLDIVDALKQDKDDPIYVEREGCELPYSSAMLRSWMCQLAGTVSSVHHRSRV